MKKLVCFLLIVALFVGILSPMAFAATVGATSYSDLAAAIAAAPADGTTITTIALENSFSATGGALTIAPGQNIVLTSTAGNIFTFTQATAGQRHFSVAGSLTLENVTLGGPGGTTLGGGVNVSGGSLTVADGTTITNCNVNGAGGAASLTHNSTFTMTGGAISDNTATTGGGALDIENGYATISGGTISGNVVTSASGFGGGIYLKAANLTMSGGELSNNRANNGGGIYVDNSGFITMTGGTISNNVATANGGGIFTAQYTSNNPLPPNSYLNLIIGSAVVFTGNVAGSGARIPPSNVAPPSTQIQTTNTSSVFGNPLNNLDINYFGQAGVMVMYLTVTFSPGANGTFPAGTVTQQNIPTTNSPLVPSAPVPVPQPTASYGFIGWSADGGTTILTAAQVLTTPISNNTTYVAQYAPPITLIFDGQLGTPLTQTVTPVQVTGTYANALSQVAIPTRTGYIFRGWFTVPNGATGGVQILPSSIVTTMTDQTLYAWWIPNPTVTIIFDGNGGTPLTQTVPSRVVGDTYAATLAAVATPTQPGFIFQGWNTQTNGLGTPITASSIIQWSATDTTVYAQWAPVPTIIITFDANGGTPDGEEESLQTGDLYGVAMTQVQRPTQPGYAFVGWFTAPTGGTQILPTTVVTATTDQTLFAQWVAVTVTVTFNAGSGTPATQVVSGLAPLTSFAPVLAAIATPTQPGYVFNGWHDQPQGMGGSTITSGSLIPPSNMTVYAWWTPVPEITVTFDATGGTPPTQTGNVTTGGIYATAMSGLTEPTMLNYAFQGWFTEPSWIAGGVQILDTTVVTATTNQTLYARWTPITVALTFDGNGGSPFDQVVSGQIPGNTYQAALAAITTPTQTGYTFDGWFDAQTGGNPITASSIVPDANTTIYAQWTQIPPIHVYFDANGGTFDSGTIIPGAGTTLVTSSLAQHTPVTVDGTFMQAMSATPDPNPPADGNTYYFGGWWTTADTSGVQVLPSSTVWNQPGDITLYVHWQLVPTVTLYFDANSGTPAMQVRRGAVVGMHIDASLFIQNPTRVGYTFLGWFDAQTSGTEIADPDLIPNTNTTYYAQWTQIPPINVFFNANGGTFDPAYIIPSAGTTLVTSSLAQHTSVTVGGIFMQAMAATPNPDPPSGFSFGGWWTTADDSGVQILPTSTVWDEPGDITLYAHWIPVPTVTITFDGNGGTPPEQTVPGQLPGTPYATALASVTTPTQSGFVFQGWFSEPTGGGLITDIIPIPPTDTTVYAQWMPTPTFAITFDANGGTPLTQTGNVTTGGIYAAAMSGLTTPTQTGFLFQGWFTAATGGVQVLYTTVVTATAPLTLYAHWIADPTITITFNGNGGTPAAQVVPGQISGHTFAATLAALTTPTQSGYVFSGWYTAATGGTQITAASIIPAGAIDRTVYAHWTPIPTINITFDAQGGTPPTQTAMDVQTGDLYGDALTLIQFPVPTQIGHVFIGWFTTPAMTIQPFADVMDVQILPDTIVTATTDQTLYAHWLALTVTLTFDAQGGAPATQIFPGKISGDSYAVTLASVTEPTKEFYTFAGWFDEPSGGTEITAIDTIPLVNTTIYAQWDPVHINIIFDALGAAPALQEEPAVTGGTFAAPFAAATTPVMPNNTFVGWFTQVIGGVRVMPTDTVTQTTDQTLYARFTPTTNRPPGGTPPPQPEPPVVPPTPPVNQYPVFREDVVLTKTHFAYLIGENVDHIAPTNAITRAEVATILLRIISDETRATFWTLENPFSDVPNNGGAWFSNAVSVANHTGIMTGLPDGTFGPNRPITRAEVVTVMVRFLEDGSAYSGTEDMFPDISGSWARDNINLAAELNWVQGDPHGNFNPNANITRAEFTTMINRMLDLTVADIDTTNMKTWLDNANTNAWFYWAMQIASNPGPGAPARNWAALQLPDARAEDAMI